MALHSATTFATKLSDISRVTETVVEPPSRLRSLLVQFAVHSAMISTQLLPRKP